MNYQQRRSEILRLLSENEGYINASELARRFGVTRQIIVSDIAILRANGNRILATRMGYRMDNAPDGLIRTIVCRHNSDQVLEELFAVVDNGGRILSVIIEHPVYGQLSADLNIASRYEAHEFVDRLRAANASQLCDLTDGMHIHTLRVPDENAFTRIRQALHESGILDDSCATEE